MRRVGKVQKNQLPKPLSISIIEDIAAADQ